MRGLSWHEAIRLVSEPLSLRRERCGTRVRNYLALAADCATALAQVSHNALESGSEPDPRQ
jgi:hypothetical protein